MSAAQAFDTFPVPGTYGPVYTTHSPVTVSVDGYFLASDTMPYIENSRTLIPLRAGAEALNAQVDWIQDDQAAVIKKGDRLIYFFAGQNNFYVNDQSHPLDVPLKNDNGRIMLPLRAFAEALNTSVDWDSETSTVNINTGGPQAPAIKAPGLNPQEDWLIDKFYVKRDEKNPIVGNWRHRYLRNGQREDAYLFVSDLGNEKAQVVELSSSPDEGNPGKLRVSAFYTIGWTDGQYLVHNSTDNPLYYYGSATGIIGSTSCKYIYKYNELVRFEITTTLFESTVDKVNETFSRF